MNHTQARATVSDAAALILARIADQDEAVRDTIAAADRRELAALLLLAVDLAADALAKDAEHAAEHDTEPPPGLGYLVAVSRLAHRAPAAGEGR